MYDTAEELLREIRAGEDSLLDWKEVTLKGTQFRFADEEGKTTVEVAKDLSCFANANGGVIVYGVRRDGEPTGIPEERMDDFQQLLLNVAQNNVEPPLGHLLLFDRVWLPDSGGNERLCLKLEIKKALFNVHAPVGRRPYWRISDQCHEMTLEQQARAFERRGLMTPFEERPVFTAVADAMELSRFREYYQQRYGRPLDDSHVAVPGLLRNLRLAAVDEAEVIRPTVLGLLLFSSHPERWISGAFVDVAVYRGEVLDSEHLLDVKTFHGTLVEQIERTMDYLKLSPYLPVAARKDDVGRVDLPAYSLRAIQEGLVNALVHRDYSISGSQVRVMLFPSRIEVSNPGRLANTLVPEDLFAGCQPVRRNQMLAGFLRDYVSPLTMRAYMEARGEGFLTLVRECEKLGARRPELKQIGDSLRLTFFSALA
jgi:predicted HTH transcriptional regulator